MNFLQIDGHHVLKANNYDMEAGEPSVFHSESASECLTAVAYCQCDIKAPAEFVLAQHAQTRQAPIWNATIMCWSS